MCFVLKVIFFVHVCMCVTQDSVVFENQYHYCVDIVAKMMCYDGGSACAFISNAKPSLFI